MLILKRILCKFLDGMIKNVIYSIVMTCIIAIGVAFLFIDLWVMFGLSLVGLLVALIIMEVVYEIVIPVKRGTTITQEILGVDIDACSGKALIVPLSLKYLMGTVLPLIFLYGIIISPIILSTYGVDINSDIYVLGFLMFIAFFTIDFLVLLVTKGRQTLVDKMLGINYCLKNNTTKSNGIIEG